jgi:hypothetical protein
VLGSGVRGAIAAAQVLILACVDRVSNRSALARAALGALQAASSLGLAQRHVFTWFRQQIQPLLPCWRRSAMAMRALLTWRRQSWEIEVGSAPSCWAAQDTEAVGGMGLPCADPDHTDPERPRACLASIALINPLLRFTSPIRSPSPGRTRGLSRSSLRS